MKSITVRQEGPSVLLIQDGEATEMPWNVALDVARALFQKAKLAEQVAKVEGLTFDQALLVRTGAPFGLTSHPDIQAEAAKEARHNPALRRYLPGGIKSQEQVGTPAIIRHPPRRPNHE